MQLNLYLAVFYRRIKLIAHTNIWTASVLGSWVQNCFKFNAFVTLNHSIDKLFGHRCMTYVCCNSFLSFSIATLKWNLPRSLWNTRHLSRERCETVIILNYTWLQVNALQMLRKFEYFLFLQRLLHNASMDIKY